VRKLRVLLVEDAPTRQVELRRLFADQECHVATTAEAAKELLRTLQFDVVFLDYDLAGPGTGEAVASELRKDHSARTTVLVHSMNIAGAARIRRVLPRALAVPYANLTRGNPLYSRLRQALASNEEIDWPSIVRGRRPPA